MSQSLSAQLSVFETTCDLLSKDIPKFTKKNSEFSKILKNFASALKSVAATESEPMLKDVLFSFGAKEQSLGDELEIYLRCEEVIIAFY